MSLLFWISLLFSVGDNVGVRADLRETCYHKDVCVTLSEEVIAAESGLCVVIPCSFKTPQSFTPQHILWYKCEKQKEHEPQCFTSSSLIYTSDKNSTINEEYRGRVSLLVSDVSQRNCSITINDLSQSDSGSYQLRVTRDSDKYTYSTKQVISVRGLSQKPNLDVPQLTDGQQTTLTCTAPGLCSGSEPTISWKWEDKRRNQRHIEGNVTAHMSVSLGALMRQYSSTLTFKASPEHHSSSVTCTVTFKHNVTTEVTKTLEVQYLKKVSITGQTRVREGETLFLNCTADSFPLSLIKWTKAKTPEVLANDTQTAALTLTNMTKERAGPYTCTAELGHRTVMKEVDVKVTYVRTPIIVGNPVVKKGNSLSLTCISESYPESSITMMKKEMRNKTFPHQASNSTRDSVLIPNVTTEDSGRYICEARYEMKTLTTHVDVTVFWFAGILNGSRCERDSAVLTCVCGSRGDPLPSISWPLLNNHSDYHVHTNVSEDEIMSSISVNDEHSVDVECVVSHTGGGTKKELHVLKLASFNDSLLGKYWKVEILVAFLVGVFLSAVVFSLILLICSRNKQKSEKHEDAGKIPLTRRADQESSKTEATVLERGPQQPEPGHRDVHYSTIDVFHLRVTSPRKASETTETEYSEIKTEAVTRSTAVEKSDKKIEEQKEDKRLMCKNQDLEKEEAGKEEAGKEEAGKEEAGKEVALYSNISEISTCTK